LKKRVVIRAAVVAVAALPLMLAGIGSASADCAIACVTTTSVVLTGGGSGNGLTVECAAVGGVADLSGVTYVVSGHATNTGQVPAASTGGTCYLRTGDGKWWGGASNAYPGNDAPVGPWTTQHIPFTSLARGVQVCGYADGTSLNNGHSHYKDPAPC
jgi:hypothetical protein